MRRWALFMLALGSIQTGLFSQMTYGIHPDYDLNNLRPSGFNPQVSAMDFLSDGRLVISTWDGFSSNGSEVLILDGVLSGNNQQVQVDTYATGLKEVLGLQIVNDSIFAQEKDQLTLLLDNNNDGNADQQVNWVSGWNLLPDYIDNPGNTKYLEFAVGLTYRNGEFFVGLSPPWPVQTSGASERGCIVRMTRNNWQPYACGFRSPNGMTIGPDGELFVIDNQGNYRPASPIVHVQQGHYYGLNKSTFNGSNTYPSGFNNLPVTPPAIWLGPHATSSIAPSKPVYIDYGLFNGQMLIGDDNMGTIRRVFLERVNSEYQGAFFIFSGGVQAGTQSMIMGPDGNIYIGGIGVPGSEWGGWNWNNQYYGLQQLSRDPNADTTFEMLAVRSISNNQFEIEFTQPVAASAGQTNRYNVYQTEYRMESGYGAGTQPNQNLNVQSASVSSNGLIVTLTVSGLTLNRLVTIELVNNFQSAGGDSPWGSVARYTLNAFGPGEQIIVPVEKKSEQEFAGRVRVLQSSARELVFSDLPEGEIRVVLVDLRGVERLSGTVFRGSNVLRLGDLPKGVYTVVLDGAAGRTTQRLALLR